VSESALDIHSPGVVDDKTITKLSFIGTASRQPASSSEDGYPTARENRAINPQPA
jgi:hypothetical protein